MYNLISYVERYNVPNHNLIYGNLLSPASSNYLYIGFSWARKIIFHHNKKKTNKKVEIY